MSGSAFPERMDSRGRDLARMIVQNLRAAAGELDAGAEMWRWPEISPEMAEALRSGVEWMIEKGGAK